MKGETGAKRKAEFTRFTKVATVLAKKSASLERERAKFEEAIQKWGRKHSVPSRVYRAQPSGPSKRCKPIISHPTGPYICVLISESPTRCVYRCFRIGED